MKSAINFIIILILVLSGIECFSKECKEIEDVYSIYFINGVGNAEIKDINTAAKAISNTVVKNKKEIKVLRNPMNNQYTDWIKNKFGTPFTWAEIEEVFSQKHQEANKYGKIIDRNVVQDMYDSLDPDTVNLVFAHSQGNLYANSLCKLNNGRKKQKNI